MRESVGVLVLVIAGVVVSGGVLWADEEVEGTNQVAETRVVVTASPIIQYERTGKDGASEAVVGREQLERLSAVDLPTALRQVPGVSISRYSPIGAYGGAQGGAVYIRGAGTARPGGEVKIYTEGVPRESGVWSHPLMDIVPIDFAESVRVAKNPQPQHYPGVFGAVDVELRRRREEGHEGELSVGYGRFNTLLSAASVGGRVDIFDYYAGVAYKYSEGARRHSKAELKNTFAQGGWSLGEHERLAYIYQHTDNWVRDPGPRGGVKPVRDQFDTMTDTHILRLESEREYLRGYTLFYFEDGEIRWRKDHLSDDNPFSPPGYSNTDWHNYGLRSYYDIMIERLTLTGSLDSWSEGGSTRNLLAGSRQRVWGYNGRYFTTAPYGGARYEFEVAEGWTLTPSAGSRYYFSNEFDNEWAPCAAVTVEHEPVSVFVSHARGVHYPGIYMRGTSPGTLRSVGAETMDTTEAGVHVELSEMVALHALYFHSDVDDRLDFGGGGYLNTGKLRVHGSEVSVHVYPCEELTLFAGGTYSDPVHKPVSRMPEWTLSGGVSYQVLAWLRWDIDAQYVSSQYAYSMRGTPDLSKLDNYMLFNTRVAFDLRSVLPVDGELYVAVENFTNQHHEYFPGYPMPGVMWYSGMKLKF